jgi:two-component SAPR family response regulator
VAAYQDFQVSSNEPEAKKSWMTEKALELFFEEVKKKHSAFIKPWEKVKAKFRELKKAPVVQFKKFPDVTSEKDSGG